MADTRIPSIYLSNTGGMITVGAFVYLSPRKGTLPKITRFIGKYLKIKRLSNWGYEVLPLIREDEFKRPIGIAIDEKTILVSGTLSLGDK